MIIDQSAVDMLSDKLPPRVQHLVKKGEKAIVIWD
jgi:hypothetical protein